MFDAINPGSGPAAKAFTLPISRRPGAGSGYCTTRRECALPPQGSRGTEMNCASEEPGGSAAGLPPGCVMSRLSASGPHRSSLWRRLRPRENAATLLRGARACLALLAAAALLALAAPAQAQTEVWTATLTPADLTLSILGCSNAVEDGTCSSTTILSEDSFNYDSTDYTITLLFVRSGGNFELTVDADITTATAALTLVVGSTSLVLADADTISTRRRVWENSGVSLTEGTDITVKLTAATTNTPPTAADNTVAMAVDTAYAFSADDFGFTDTDAGDTLASVKIVTLPTPGTLALDGTAVLADADVTKSQIDGNMLTFTPVAGASSTTGYASFTFKVNDGTVDSASAYTMTIDVTTGSACAAPDFGTRRNFWTGEVTVAPREIGGNTVSYGFVAIESVGSLDDREFSIGSNSYTVDGANAGIFGLMSFSLTSNLTDTEVAALKLHVCDVGYDFADATTHETTISYSWIDDIDWSMESTRTLHLSLPANNPATGTPTITGTATIGQELTADASPIMDIDGLTGVDFTYQWLRVDADGTSNEEDITDATDATYTLTNDDGSKKVKVKVSFTDNLNGEETRTSAAYPPSGTVAVACPAPDFGTRRNIWTGEVTVAPREVGGNTVSYGFVAIESVGSLDDREFSIGSNSYTVDGANAGIFGLMSFSLTSNLTDTEVAALKLHVCDVGYDFADATTNETTNSFSWIDDIDWSMESTRTLHLSLPANNPATGTPTITGTATIGQELTADASPIMDIDGLTGVDFTYQWLRVDADGTSNEEDITDATDATYTLTNDDGSKKVKVKVSFTDNLNGEETRTSAAYPPSGTVAVACPAPDFGTRRNIWTGEVTVAPREVGGNTVSYGFVAIESVGSLDDREFSIGSNSYTVDGANAGIFGLMSFSLTSNLTDTEVAALKLHVCDVGYDFADATTNETTNSFSWIDDIDWSMESTRTLHLSLPANNPATGTPTITGTAQVGEELTADASPIMDTDGLADVDFTYQWLRVDSDGTSNPVDITDANAATYTLTNDDLGKKVKVKVSFTDNLNGEETRTSDAYPSSATVTVAGGTNTPPTAANNTVTTGEDMPYTFMAGDFGFADTDTGATLASVKIVTTPALGTLALDGTAVLADGVVTKAQIDGDMLTFRPAQDAHGVAYTTFTFKVNDGTDDSASAYTMTIDVTDAPAPVCTAPSFGDRREIWTGTVTVEEFSFIGTVTGYGFQASTGISSLLPSAEFSIGSSDHTISAISVGVSGTLIVTVDANVLLTATEEAALRLHVCDENLDFSSASAVSAGYAWTGTRDWSDPVVTRTLYLSLPANNVATGEPAITGTAQVGQVLTADATPIVDDDGLTDVDFTYQWLRVDADGTSNEEDISGEIAATYTLADDDEGKKVKVKVSFTDELSGEEERTSAAYPSSGTVTAAASTNNAPTSTEQLVDADEDTDYTFSADDFGFADTDAGDSLVSVKIVTLPASGTGTLTLSGTAIGSGDLPQTVLADDLDELKYSPPANLYGTDVASFTFKVNDGTVDSDNAYTMTIDVKGEDDSATGAPGITGTAQVGQTLTATVGTIADLDGLPDPFISHSLTTIQWIQVDGVTETDISGATNETYTLATADAGKKIKVKVSFEDEGGTAEGPLTSDAYPASGTVTAAGTNNAPVFSSSNVSRSIAENTAAGQDVGAAVTATDADAGDNLTYTLGGADMASFDIVGTTGQIRTKTNVSYDFEAKSSYAVTVTASDGTATAVASVTIGITDVDEPPSAPATPSISAVSGSSTSLSVSWAAPANAGKPAIASYDVQYRAGTSGSWSDGPENVAATTTIVTGLVADMLYQARVRATNAEGDSGWSSPPGSGRTNAPITSAPGAPGKLRTTPDDGRVTLAWMAPRNIGGAAILKYQYRARRTGTTAWTPDWMDVPDGSDPGGSAADETRVTVSGLTNGTRYRFEVRAVNSIGEGPAATIRATPASGAVRRLPGAVVGLTATADKYADDRRGRHYGRVTLSWSPSAGDDNLVLVRFEHRYAEDDSVLPAEWTHGPSDRLSQTIDRLKHDTLYIFEVRAVSIGGPGPAVQRSSRTPERPAGMSLFAPRQTAIEGGTATFEVHRSANTDRDTFVMVGVTDSAFPDIPALGGPQGNCAEGGCGAGGRIVKFKPDATSVTGTITVEFDGARPTSRSLTVTLASVERPHYFFGTPTTLSITVTDRDAAVSVRDAQVREATGAVLAFVVTLDRRRDREVMVNYATSDGTATQGDDYTRTAGTLVFSADERSKTVSVPVIDDDHDEGSETLMLTLSNARGAVLGDATATGTIVNSDPLPDAWLSRFGRAASDHVVQSIGRRLEGGQSESHLTVMGWRVDTLLESTHSERDAREPRPDAPGRQPEASVAPDGRIGAAGAMAGGTRGVDAMSDPGAARPAFDGAMTQGLPPMQGGKLQSPARAVGASDNRWLGLMERLLMSLGPNGGEAIGTPGLRDMVMGSSFYYGYSPDAGPLRSMNRLTAWGESASTRFSGAEGKLSLDGEVNTAIVGADGEWGRWLAGLALSYSEGEGGYRRVSANGGAVSSTLTGINPYARYRLDERTSFWATLGYGSGRLTLTPDGVESALETDMTNAMAAFGGRGVLSMRTGKTGQFELALRSDAMLTDTASIAVPGLSSGAGATSRIRLILEGSGSLPAFGGVLAPSVEAGLRYDGGDAETGAGLEVGGGLAYGKARFTVQVDGRVLLTHRDRDYEEWGYSLSLVYQPSEDGRGLRYQSGSQWGATQSGVQSLWSLQNAGGLANGARTANGQRYTAELGYGFGVGGRLWYPYVATESAGASSQALRFGLKFNAGSALEAGLEIGRRAYLPGEMENDIQLRWQARW